MTLKEDSQRPLSRELYRRAKQQLPGGVNSPVRTFATVGSYPIIAESAKGALLRDVDGHDYLDYIGSWGPMILGHADEEVVAAVQQAVSRGVSFGLATQAECELAELLIESVASLERVRLVNSGTEATMSALRLARGFTKRNKLIKFAGCYHGHVDALLVQAGSGVATHHTSSKRAPSSAGVPESVIEETLVLPFNDLEAVSQQMQQQGDKIAAIIVEPLPGNMGVVPPIEGFLKGLRDLCDRHESLLIFDEVMSGFRVARGGAQQLYGVRADLTTLGKIIGGGLPVGAYGGRADIMDHVSPRGDVYQAGTLSGNPVTVAAGLATLRKLLGWRDPQSGVDAYGYLERLGKQLEQGLQPLIKESGCCFHRVGSMFTLFFTPGPVHNFTDVAQADHSANGAFARFHRGMLANGILLPPSGFEAAFISLAHTEESIAKTVAAISSTLRDG